MFERYKNIFLKQNEKKKIATRRTKEAYKQKSAWITKTLLDLQPMNFLYLFISKIMICVRTSDGKW